MAAVNRISKVILRADGNSQIGFGHLVRLVAIAEMLADRFECHFVCQSSETNLIPAKFSITSIPDGVSLIDEPSWLASNFASDDFMLIADGYQFNAEYFVALEQLNFEHLYIDDFGVSYKVSRILNHGLNARKQYKRSLETLYHLGPKYALLRNEFLQSNEGQDTGGILIAFGGSDVKNLSLPAVQACLEMDEFSEIHVVRNSDSTDLNEVATGSNRVTLHSALSSPEMAELMNSCSYALCSASTILYELASLRKKTIIGYYADNQEEFYDGANNIIAQGLGDISAFGKEDFRSQLSNLINSDWSSILENHARIFDHKSPERINKVVEQMSARLSLRECTPEDVDLVYSLSNDPLVRENSYHSEPIKYENHIQWFRNKLKSEKSNLWVATIAGEDAGLIRFDIEGNHAVVGILVKNEFRGNSLAAPVLDLACEQFHNRHSMPIWAYIKKSNIASVKSFKRANFEHLKEETVDGQPSFILSLEP